MRAKVSELSMLVAGVILAASMPGAEAAAAGSSEVMATVAGRPLYDRDLEPAMAGQLLQLRQKEYEIKRKALDETIDKALVDAEAARAHLSADQLMAREVDARIPEPSDSDLSGYYLALQAQLNKPFDEVKELLRQRWKQAKAQQARADYLAKLRAAGNVVVKLSPPRVGVEADPARVTGNPDAPITIVEFADYQCPYCGRAESTLKEVLTGYDGKVKLSFRDFPLSQIHSYAMSAAEAARCAGEQGKFWEYHKLLFADQAKLDQESLKQHAADLKLDEGKFAECLASGKFASAIQKDEEAGRQAGVSGTPGFFINGIFLNGAVPAENFRRVIDEELARNMSDGGRVAVSGVR